jgi:hypothetical protein
MRKKREELGVLRKELYLKVYYNSAYSNMVHHRYSEEY